MILPIVSALLPRSSSSSVAPRNWTDSGKGAAGCGEIRTELLVNVDSSSSEDEGDHSLW